MARGLEIAVFGTDPQTRNRYLLLAIAEGLRADPRVCSASVLTQQNLVTACHSGRFDGLLVIGGAGAIVEPLRRAIAAVPLAALWTTEDPYELWRNVELAPLFDIVFTNEAAAVSAYQGLAAHLPLAASPALHRHAPCVDPAKWLTDLFFVGTAWPERVAFLNTLLLQLPSRLRKTIGLSGNRHVPPFQLEDFDLLTRFRLAPRTFARYANRSAISLSVDRSFTGEGPTVMGSTPPPRLFELALAGAPQVYVTERSGIADVFAVGDEIVIAKDAAEAADRIAWLVDDRVERNRLATAAYERTCAQHLYQHRANRIVDGLLGVRRHIIATPSRSGRRVLRISHNIEGRGNFGGIEVYQASQAAAMPDIDFFTLFSDPQTGKLALQTPDGSIAQLAATPLPESTLFCDAHAHALNDVISTVDPELIHYNHLLGHPLSTPLVLSAFGIPSIWQMHDYFPVCREFNLIGIDGRYCNVKEPGIVACDVCLSTRGIAPPNAQTRRRRIMHASLAHMDAIVHNSQYTLRKTLQIFPDLDPSRHSVIGNTPRGSTIEMLQSLRPERLTDYVTQRLKVAVLGNFSRQKGGDLLVAAFQQMRQDPIDFEILGRVDADMLSGLSSGNFENVQISGSFTQSDLAARLRGKDVSLHLSIWPETYCISLDEARAAGLVPIVVGLGALAERVQHERDGLVLDPAHPFDLVGHLRRLSIDTALLRRLGQHQTDFMASHDAHFAALDRVYRSASAARPAPATPPDPPKERHRRLLLGDLDWRFGSNSWMSDAIVWDEPLETVSRQVLRLELVLKLAQLERRSASSLKTAPAAPGDDSLKVMVDDLIGPMLETATALLSPVQTGVTVALGLPRGRQASPCAVHLLGPIVLRAQITTPGVTDPAGLMWTGALLQVSEIPFGIYAIGFEFEGRGLCVSGCRLVIGDMSPTERIAAHGILPSPPQPWRLEVPAPKNRGRSPLHRLLNHHRATYANDKVHVDYIAGKAPPANRMLMIAAGAALRVEGWAMTGRNPVPYAQVFIRLGDEAHTVIEAAAIVARKDVAAHFSKAILIDTGFAATLQCATIPDGAYQLEVISVKSNGKVTVHTICKISLVRAQPEKG